MSKGKLVLRIGDNSADFREVLRENLTNNIGHIRADKFIDHKYDMLLDYFYSDVVAGKSHSDANLDEVSIQYWPGNKGTYNIEYRVDIDKYTSVTQNFSGITAHFSNMEDDYKFEQKKMEKSLILEREDWSKDEWNTITKIFGMQEALRIEIPAGVPYRTFGIPKK